MVKNEIMYKEMLKENAKIQNNLKNNSIRGEKQRNYYDNNNHKRNSNQYKIFSINDINDELFSLYNKSINILCERIKENEICNFMNEYTYGNVNWFNNENDTNKTCQNPKKKKMKNMKMNECENEYECLNNKFTKYFSLKWLN